MTLEHVGNGVWHYMLSVAALPAVLLFFEMMRMPESPRWMALKGHFDDALNTLKKLRGNDNDNATNNFTQRFCKFCD